MRTRATGTTATPGLWTVFSRLLPAALVAGVFVAAGLIHVTSRVLVVDVGYKRAKAEQQGRELTREHDRLKLELATLKSPTRLEKIAREQLAMVPPPPGAVLSLASPPPSPARAVTPVRSANVGEPVAPKPPTTQGRVARRDAP